MFVDVILPRRHGQADRRRALSDNYVCRTDNGGAASASSSRRRQKSEENGHATALSRRSFDFFLYFRDGVRRRKKREMSESPDGDGSGEMCASCACVCVRTENEKTPGVDIRKMEREIKTNGRNERIPDRHTRYARRYQQTDTKRCAPRRHGRSPPGPSVVEVASGRCPHKTNRRGYVSRLSHRRRIPFTFSPGVGNLCVCDRTIGAQAL